MTRRQHGDHYERKSNSFRTLDVDVAVTVDTLWLDGSQKRNGTWGAPSSGADHENDHFTGSSAFLTVTTSGIPPGALLIVK
ncbi:MAG: hypothetical protein HN341_07800 [Verrucomicrobia bacterium]|jgi:hypothetical protein|nr:hypothetical protein [Verrucomicrobiota bacterium]